jgi:RHS repeat-associated protein
MGKLLFVRSGAMTWQNALQLASRTDFNGYTTTFTYDADGNLLEKTADPAHPSLVLNHAPAKVRYTYNAFDLPATAETVTTGGSVLTSKAWTYDAHGRLMAVAAPGGTLNYTRDIQDRITGVSSSNAGGISLQYGHNTAGQLSTITDHRHSTPRVHSINWLPSGAIDNVQSTNGLKHHYTRDSQKRVTQLSIADSANSVLETFGHSYNDAGRRTTSVEGSGRSISYAYNNIHRLTSEEIAVNGVSAGLPTTPGTLGYDYDAVGNRLTRTSDLAAPAPGNQAFSYNNNDELAGVTYDLNGNPTASNGNTDIYDFEDRLIRRTRSDGTVIDLAYDAEGNRVQKTVTAPGQPTKATTYLIDSASASGWPQCVEEVLTQPGTTNQAQRTIYQYGPHGPISQQTTGSPEADFLLDAHGSVRALADANGHILAAADYDAYSIPLATAGTIATTSGLGYNGEYYDADLGLIYLRARYYDPSTGRFLNRDPYQGAFEDPQSLHAYHFTGNDPVNGIDPSGNFFLPELLASISLRASITSQQIIRYEKIIDQAITLVGSLYVALNYWSSLESVYTNAISGSVARSPGAWGKQSLSLLRAGKYNWDLLKEFKKNTSQTNPAATAGRVVKIAATISRSIDQLVLLGSGRSGADFADVNLKRNGLPEFTPYVGNGAITFITGKRGATREGLTGRHSTDLARARASFLGIKLTGTTGAWHHHEVMGVMQHVTLPEHSLPHAGGKFFWTIMKGKEYK